MLGLVLLFILLLLFIRSPWGQDIIVQKAVSWAADKTGSRIELERLFITLDGDVNLEGLYLEDMAGDTLFYTRALEVDIPFIPIIRGEGVGVDALRWDGLRAHVHREDSIQGYNFQFLIDAFVTDTATQVAVTDTAAAEPMSIVLGPMSFTDFDLTFDDQVMGIDSRLRLGELSVDIDEFDMENMVFGIDQVRLADVDVRYDQSLPFATDTAESTSPLPRISLANLTLENITARYASSPDGLIADVDIDRFLAEVPKIDLETADYVVDKLSLTDSRFDIQMSASSESATVAENEVVAAEASLPFTWPDIKADLRNIRLENNSIDLTMEGGEETTAGFDPNDVHLSRLDLIVDRVSLLENEAIVELENLSFYEASGIDLKQLAVVLTVNDRLADMSGLALALNGSSINGRMNASYPSIQRAMDEPGDVRVDMLLSALDIDIADAFHFDPSLKEMAELRALSKKRVGGRIEVLGTLADLRFTDDRLNWGQDTRIAFGGTLSNATDMDRLTYAFPNVTLQSTRSDALRFIDEDSLGIRLPDQFSVALSANGDLEGAEGTVALKSSQGNVNMRGRFDMAQDILFDVDLTVDEYQLGQLLQNEAIGSLSLSVNTNGSGTDINDLDAELQAVVQQMTFNGYDIQDLELSGQMNNGAGTVTSRYKDENLNVRLLGAVELDSIASEFMMDLDVIGIDMQALGLVEKPIRAALRVQAEFKGDPETFDLAADITNGTFVYDTDAYRLGPLGLVAHVTPDTTSAQIDNELIDLDLRSNTDPASFTEAITRHLRSYFETDSIRTDSIDKPVDLVLNVKINQAPILSEVLVDKLNDLDTIRFDVAFDEQKRILDAEIHSPHIDYDGYLVDSLNFILNTLPDEFTFDLGFSKVEAGPILLKSTSFSGQESDGRLDLAFTSYDDEEKLIQVISELSGENGELLYHIDPEGLIVNRKPWEMPPDNLLTVGEKEVRFQEFRLSRDSQSVELSNEVAGVEKDHIALLFQNFKLSDLLSYLNPDEQLAAGRLQGNLIVEEPFGGIGLLADLDISAFKVLDVDMGRLALDASSKQLDNYDFDLKLKDGSVDLDLTGDLTATDSEPEVDLMLDLNRFDMAAIEAFSGGELTEASGDIKGRFTVKGSAVEPRYEGQLDFDQARFTVNQLNTSFSLPAEKLAIDNDALTMDAFSILDANGNSFELSGKVLTEELSSPEFDLQVNADDFQVLNATEEDNEYVYGVAAFDVDGTIKGNIDIPIVDVTLHVNPSTDITYILPVTAAQLEERDGVVIFVNRKDPDAILTRTEEVTATLSGFDIKALLQVDKEAKVKVIIDEETGDFFEVSGEGDLQFGMESNGRMSLAGVYNVSSGSYELNLYGLVKRRFELSPASKVSWAGDPFDAKLDIRAIYTQEASSAPLMASVTSGLDPNAKSRYRQVLPFYVYLNVEGSLDAPELSFALDMPEDEQGALGGQVFGRIQQVNAQEDELNKQVFSLLVLNRFYPEPGSDGSTGGVASVARNNLNDALSDQLNVFSDKLLSQTGVQLDFGLDSYTDYQGDGATERTQLDVAAKKSLFNDRLIVSVGSEVDIQGGNTTNEATPLIGKVSIEYVLTPEGQYRLKGFRRNEFENVIDGQTIVSGIALIFTQEFNEFDELWKAILRKKDETDQDGQ